MVSIKKISKPKVYELIKGSYDGDKDLSDKYHVIAGSAEELATETMTMIDDASRELNLSYFKVVYRQHPIGYLVTSKEFLYSFAIYKSFRKKDILIEWWAAVKNILGTTFSTMLYANNTRAISFLVKNGMEIYSTDGNLVTLINYT